MQVMRAPVGGLFRHVSDLTQVLAERGHQISIVADSTLADAQSEARLNALESCASLGIHRLAIPRLLGPQDISTPLRIRALTKALDIDILHGHGAKGGFGARLAGAGTRRKTVYTPHGGALHFDPRSTAGRVFMSIERGLLRTTDALIFESAYAQRIFTDNIALASCRQEIIHNGLDDSEFDVITPLPDAADFAFVGELRALKGVDLLLGALKPLTRPDGKPATLIMAGDGPDAGSVKDTIRALDLTERVTLAGVRPAREIFARGRCVLVPSRAESLPYVVMEAAAAGRPIIATDVGGIPEIFGPTADRLIEPNSVDALREAMAQCLGAPAEMEREAATRRAFVRAQFFLTRMVTSIEALYRDLLA